MEMRDQPAAPSAAIGKGSPKKGETDLSAILDDSSVVLASATYNVCSKGWRGCRVRRAWLIACAVALAVLLAAAAGVTVFFIKRAEEALERESRQLEAMYLNDTETPRVVRNDTDVLQLETSLQEWVFNRDVVDEAQLNAYMQAVAPRRLNCSEIESMLADAAASSGFVGVENPDLDDSRFEDSSFEAGVYSDNDAAVSSFDAAASPEVAATGGGTSGGAARRLLTRGRALLQGFKQRAFGGRRLQYAYHPYNGLKADDFSGARSAALAARPLFVREHARSTVRIITGWGTAKRFRCTGTLVAADIVLTAAHCVVPDDYPAARPSGGDITGLRVQLYVNDDVALYTSKVATVRWSKRYNGRTRNGFDQYDHDYLLLELASRLGDVAGWAGIRRMLHKNYLYRNLQPELRGKVPSNAMLTFMGFPTIYDADSCDHTPCYTTNAMSNARGHACQLGHPDYRNPFKMTYNGLNVRHTCWSGGGGSGSSLQQHTYGRGWAWVVGLMVKGNSDDERYPQRTPRNTAVPTFLFYSMWVKAKNERAAASTLMSAKVSNTVPVQKPIRMTTVAGMQRFVD